MKEDKTCDNRIQIDKLDLDSKVNDQVENLVFSNTGKFQLQLEDKEVSLSNIG